MYIVSVLYYTDPIYCASADLEDSNPDFEFKRHPEDTGDSTIRLVRQTPDINGQRCDSASLV